MTQKYGDAFGFKQGGRTDFWLGKGEVGTPTHLAFTAATHAAMEGFYRAAIKAGGQDNGAPGVRKGYGYAAFVHDLDGHNVEAVCFDELGEDKTLEEVQKKRIAKAKNAKKKGPVRKR